MYRSFLFAAVFCVLFSACASAPVLLEDDGTSSEKPGAGPADYIAIPPYLPDLPVSPFGEIWGYLIDGREETLKTHYPLSDVGYFGAEIDSYGALINVPDREKISFFTGRVHMVIVCNSRALTHFILEEGSSVRRRLVEELLGAAEKFDGLQIDFELVPAKDGESFRSFLAELREGLGDKAFTIALPARKKIIEDDVYDYESIAPLVDRILVMAYDEHWSTSEPGPIASMDWCRAVAEHALGTIGPEKLIMGLPFYGRTWGNVNTFRAFFFTGIERIKAENHVTEIRREGSIPTFIYEIPVTVTVYYEDDISLSTRMEMYREMGVRSIGFWALGQESSTIWDLLHLSE